MEKDRFEIMKYRIFVQIIQSQNMEVKTRVDTQENEILFSKIGNANIYCLLTFRLYVYGNT